MKSLYLSTLALIILIPGVIAQTTKEKDPAKITIDVAVTENGETKTEHEEIIINPGEDLQKILEGLHIWDNMNAEGPGERFEINIQKMVEDGVEKDVDIEIDFPFDFPIHFSNSCHPKKAFLGVVSLELTEEKATALGLKKAQGVLLTEVVGNSPAEKAELKAGDVLISVNGYDVNTHDELSEVIKKNQPGENLDLRIYRNGKFINKKVETGEKNVHAYTYKYHKSDMNSPEDFFGEFDIDMSFGPKPFLGVSGQDAEDGEGAAITRVYPGSTAEGMGLKKGDKIISVNGNSTSSFSDLRREISRADTEKDCVLEVIRNNENMSFTGSLKNKSPMVCKQPYNFNFGPQNTVMTKKIVIEIDELNAEEKRKIEVEKKPELTMDSFSILPNPTSGSVQLSFALDQKGPVNIQVRNIEGKKVLEENYKEKQSYSGNIDLSSQPSGIYFLIVESQGKVFAKKVIRE